MSWENVFEIDDWKQMGSSSLWVHRCSLRILHLRKADDSLPATLTRGAKGGKRTSFDPTKVSRVVSWLRRVSTNLPDINCGGDPGRPFTNQNGPSQDKILMWLSNGPLTTTGVEGFPHGSESFQDHAILAIRIVLLPRVKRFPLKPLSTSLLCSVAWFTARPIKELNHSPLYYRAQFPVQRVTHHAISRTTCWFDSPFCYYQLPR